jgi:glycosyltransferase involved in cell wall biosynthesis
MKSLRIGVFYPGELGRFRGTPLRAVNLVRSLVELGDVVVTASYDDSGLDISRVSHTTISPYRSGFRLGSRLAKIFKENDCDVILGVTHNSVLPGWIASRRSGIPIVIDVHGSFPDELKDADTGSWKYRLKHRLIARYVLPRCDGFAVVGENLRKKIGASLSNSVILEGGVDTDKFSPDVLIEGQLSSWKAESSKELIVGYAGNFRGYQGVDLILEAARSVSESLDAKVGFLLIGDGATGATVQELLEKYGLRDDFLLIDAQPYENIPSWLVGTDILLVPRPNTPTTHFAFPSKLPEYMAMGKAIIASDVANIDTVMVSGRNGILIAPGSSEQLANAIVRLGDKALRENLGHSARSTMVDEHTWHHKAKTLHDLLEKVIRS